MIDIFIGLGDGWLIVSFNYDKIIILMTFMRN